MLGLKLWMLPLGGALAIAAVLAVILLPRTPAESTPAAPPASAESNPANPGVEMTPPEISEMPEMAVVEPALPSIVTPPGGTPAPDFRGIDAWLNSPPRTLEDLRGQVVLVDFWTYSGINCKRTLPYVRSWHDKYADRGLVGGFIRRSSGSRKTWITSKKL